MEKPALATCSLTSALSIEQEQNAEADNNEVAYERHHILKFGDETLLHIIRFLHGSNFDHSDLVSLAGTCVKLNSLLLDRSLCEVIKFTWAMQVARGTLVGYIKQRTRCDFVTKLDITDLYWVPSGTLRDAVVQMRNLKELLAAGARLSWAHLNQILTTLCSIESLSWSYDTALEELIRKKGSMSPARFRELLDLKPKLTLLKNLLVHVPLASIAPTDLIVCSFTSLVYLISLCQNLEQLYIHSWPKTSQERKQSSNFFQEIFETDDINLPKLSVLVVDIKEPPRIHIPRLILKLLKNFQRNQIAPRVLWLDDPLINKPCLSTRRGITAEDRIWPELDLSRIEQFSLPLMNETLMLNFPQSFPTCKKVQISHGMPRILNLNRNFDGASELESMCCKAFNFKLDWRKLPLYHPKLKEVNISKNEGVSYPDYCVALAEMTMLRKISIPVESIVEIKDAKILAEFKDCVPDECAPKEAPAEASSTAFGFKKRRIGAPTKPLTVGVSGLQLLTHRCTEVEEIEIGYSSKSCHAGRLLVDSLFSMTKWKYLRKVSLDGLPIKNGKFLVEIAKTAQLESIKLSNLGPSGRCAYLLDLSSALRYCHSLKDLRLEQNYLGSVVPLLKALSNCVNLQRVLLWSSPNDSPLDCDGVVSLFNCCKNLVVFYAVIEPTLKSVCKKLKKLLTDKYKTERPALSIFIETSLEDDRIPMYPSVHFRQLVVNNSQICQYNDFPSFSSNS